MNSNILYPPTYLYLAILFMVGLHFLLPTEVVFIANWKLIGAVNIIFGIFLNLAADKLFKKYDTTVKPGEDSEVLLTDGVFKISRNPMYLGMVLILFGSGFILGSLPPFLVIPIFIRLIDTKFIKIEEYMLKKKFGMMWFEYTNTTRKWI
ncbi:MAG: isoprenylcysteine carboxylmethyltransferase family protein [Melioribacteraceae bacterium]|nr:isoprenylcysteine carboxylmethyltransferase family protein [Melioribacteraceae bacterium]